MDDDPTRLSTRIQMLATLVATATYVAGFNPPGGVWQDIHDAAGHLPGDPIMRSNHFFRYPVFFYGNAIAFTLSLIVVVVTLFIATNPKDTNKRINWYLAILMAAAMVAFTLAYGAGACRTKLTMIWYCVQVPLPFLLVIYLAFTHPRWWIQETVEKEQKRKAEEEKKKKEQEEKEKKRKEEEEEKKKKEQEEKEKKRKEQEEKEKRKQEEEEEEKEQEVKEKMETKLKENQEYNFRALQRLIMFQLRHEYFVALQRLMVPLSMFALTITYVGGLSTPGGFWDNAEGGHRPGDAILGDRFQGTTLRGFLTFNTTAFLGSMYALSLLMVPVKKFRRRFPLLCLLALLYLLIGLLGAYIVGNSRGRVNWPLYGEVFACMVAYVVVHVLVMKTADYYEVSSRLVQMCRCAADPPAITEIYEVATAMTEEEDKQERRRRAAARRRYLVQMMAGLAVAITYQAGLYPPGGLWPSNTDGHTAGDPILFTTNYIRYRGFHYCNSVSFVASLLVVLLVHKKKLHKHHVLEAAMLLDMLGLVGAYAIGSCRDQVSTLYVAGLAGAGVVYVFVHVSYFTLGDDADGGAGREENWVENIGGRFLLFAVLVASITYQAGLTPPGGFLLQDDAQSRHHAGDPVLLYNYPRRYKAFFYCNSVSFMLSIVLIVLLINPNHYRTAIKSQALTVCSAVSYVCLVGAFAAGSTQHRKGSYSILVLAALPSLSSAILFFKRREYKPAESHDESSSSYRDEQIKNEYLMTLAILVASATYPAGLDPPGGSWQSSSDGHDAGNPVMHDSRRQRYLAFFVGNTASFLASLMLILVLLLAMLRPRRKADASASPHGGSAQLDWSWSLFRKRVNGALVSLQCLGFLVAYAAGSSRRWKTSVYTGVSLVIFVLTFFFIHILLSMCLQKKKNSTEQTCPNPCNHGRMQLV